MHVVGNDAMLKATLSRYLSVLSRLSEQLKVGQDKKSEAAYVEFTQRGASLCLALECFAPTTALDGKSFSEPYLVFKRALAGLLTSGAGTPGFEGAASAVGDAVAGLERRLAEELHVVLGPTSGLDGLEEALERELELLLDEPIRDALPPKMLSSLDFVHLVGGTLFPSRGRSSEKSAEEDSVRTNRGHHD